MFMRLNSPGSYAKCFGTVLGFGSFAARAVAPHADKLASVAVSRAANVTRPAGEGDHEGQVSAAVCLLHLHTGAACGGDCQVVQSV